MVVKYERSTKLLEKQLQEDPENVFAWYNLIRMYRNQRRFETVVQKGNYVLNNLSFDGCENIYLMIGFDTATACMEVGDLESVERYCRKVLRCAPDFLDILFLLGQVYFRKKRYHDALNYLRQFLLAHDKLYQVPQLHFLSLGTIDFDYLACSIIGDCFIAIGDTEQAIDYYNKALILFSNRGNDISRKMAVPKDVLLTLGNISIRVGNFAKAAEFFEAYLKQDTANAQVLNNLAGCFVQLKQNTRARSFYQKALALDPNYTEAKRNLMVLTNKQKRSSVAIQE